MCVCVWGGGGGGGCNLIFVYIYIGLVIIWDQKIIFDIFGDFKKSEYFWMSEFWGHR